MVSAIHVMRKPTSVIFRRHNDELWKTLKYSAENNVGDRLLHFVDQLHIADFSSCLPSSAWLFFPLTRFSFLIAFFAGDNVKTDRHVEILRSGPERIVF